jgi:hypothetical protein
MIGSLQSAVRAQIARLWTDPSDSAHASNAVQIAVRHYRAGIEMIVKTM